MRKFMWSAHWNNRFHLLVCFSSPLFCCIHFLLTATFHISKTQFLQYLSLLLYVKSQQFPITLLSWPAMMMGHFVFQQWEEVAMSRGVHTVMYSLVGTHQARPYWKRFFPSGSSMCFQLWRMWSTLRSDWTSCQCQTRNIKWVILLCKKIEIHQLIT